MYCFHDGDGDPVDYDGVYYGEVTYDGEVTCVAVCGHVLSGLV